MGYEDIQATHRTLLAQYTDRPRGTCAASNIEHELTMAEDALLSRSPFKAGLLGQNEVRANATEDGLKTLRRLNTDTLWDRPRVTGESEFELIRLEDIPAIVAEKRRTNSSIRDLVPHILDQNRLGSCALEGLAGGIMTCEAIAGVTPVEKLNPLPAYGAVNGGQDRGASPQDAIAHVLEHGIPSQQVWPRSIGWRRELSDKAVQDALRHRPLEVWRAHNAVEVASAVIRFPVYCYWPGHAFYMVDALDEWRGVMCNSWSTNWSDGGFSTIRWDRLTWMYGPAWVIRTCVRPSER